MYGITAFWSISSIVQLAVYIVSALAFFKLAKLRCMPYPWLAFIPLFNLYVIGYIGDTLKYNTAPFNRYLSDVPLAYTLPILSIVSSMAWAVPFFGRTDFGYLESGGLSGAGHGLPVCLPAIRTTKQIPVYPAFPDSSGRTGTDPLFDSGISLNRSRSNNLKLNTI